MSEPNALHQAEEAQQEPKRRRLWLFWAIALGLLAGSFCAVYFPLQIYLRPLLGEPVAGKEPPPVLLDQAHVIHARLIGTEGDYLVEIQLMNQGTSPWTPGSFWLEPLTSDAAVISLPHRVDGFSSVTIRQPLSPEVATAQVVWRLVGPRGPVPGGEVRLQLR